MIITISGQAGSGKSTAAKKLAEALGWERFYIGGLRRDMAARRGMSLEEYNKLGEKDPTTDREADEFVKKLGRARDNIIVEGRLAWHFIPNSFKIYLTVDEKEGARRVFKELQGAHERNEGEGVKSINEMIKLIRAREASDKKRYQKYYNVDAYDPKNYDFVLNTTHLKPEETFKILREAIIKRRAVQINTISS